MNTHTDSTATDDISTPTVNKGFSEWQKQSTCMSWRSSL